METELDNSLETSSDMIYDGDQWKSVSSCSIG
jgi:hypothetical protein